MGILSTLLTIAGGVWGMGGNLRLIYERSADSRQQSEDRLQTLQRVIAFGAWVVAIVSYEAYLVELEEAAALSSAASGDATSEDPESSSGGHHPNQKRVVAFRDNGSFISSTNPANV